MFVTEKEGAQSALIAATQPLARGSYWHNVFGLADLGPTDIALNDAKSRVLWDRMEALAAPYFKAF